MRRRKRRQRRSRTEWSELVAQQQASNLTQHEFCIQHGLSRKTFGNWKRRLDREAASNSLDSPWIEVAPHPQPTVSASWEIELDLGDGVVLRMRR